MPDALGGLFESFINYLFSTGDITVSSDFHTRCSKVNVMFDNDVSGIVSSIIDYSINSASEAVLKVECSDETTEKLFNLWLSKINLNVNGVPTGLMELAKEYYKERWAGSSLCLMRVSKWEKISIDNNSIRVPTLLYFVNGASVYIDRKNEKNYKIGTDKYFLDAQKKNEIPKGKDEKIIVQKPFARWFSKYPSPYVVKKGILKNWMAMEVLASKGDEAISKVLPYLFEITKGDKDVFLKKGTDYSDPELETLIKNFKKAMERYKRERGKVPATAIPFDQKYKHLIPDLLPILKEELYRQGYRTILSGLGFIDLLEITPSRQEARINPRPFIAEVNAGITNFKSMLTDVIRLIISQNKIDHKKLFSDKKVLKIVNSPLKINVQLILDSIRSGYVYGAVSVETYQESLGIDPGQELERMRKEWRNGLRELFYPHVIQNTERDPDTNISLPPITKKEVEKKKEKETEPGNMQEAKIEETENYYRVRQIDPEKFEKDSFRTIWISKSKGIKAIIGRLKGEKITTVQSLLFDKKKWTKEKIKKWIKEHSDKFHAYLEIAEDNLEENLEIAPYDKNNPPAFLKKYPKGAQKVFIEVFNKNLPKGEDYAFPVAWTALKRWLKKHGYKKVNDKWVKSEEINNE